MDVDVCEYTDADYRACRSLWADLTEHHRRIYGDSSIGGDDPGAEFDQYLSDPARVGSWVAQVEELTVGLSGLLARGRSADVEPVVVAPGHRGKGIGRRLVEHVVEAARSSGFEFVTLRPVARNVGAIRSFHALGFRTLGGHIDLTMDLSDRAHEWHQGLSLHGLDFAY
jgi:GNAT superfamily N-acetyltransferase